jgi:hypothetical protein
VGIVNDGRPSLFALIARLPMRIWLQATLGLIGFAVLAVLGFAVVAGVVAIALAALLIYRLRLWFATVLMGRSMSGPPAPPDSPGHVEPGITDATYEIIDRRGKDRRGEDRQGEDW